MPLKDGHPPGKIVFWDEDDVLALKHAVSKDEDVVSRHKNDVFAP